MTQIIGGHNLGLFDGSFTNLNRNDRTGLGTMGHGQQTYANVSNGNLIFQERDIYLPSFGQDFDFIRTYNSRGDINAVRSWTFSLNVTFDKDFKLLSVTDNNGVATTFDYKGTDVIAIHDDTGHLLTLNYTSGRLTSVTEKINNVVTVLVQYTYTSNLLTQVTDRFGHVTT